MEAEPSAPGGIVSERKVRCALDVAAAAWLLEAKDLDGARRVLESVLATLPHDVRARTMLAQVLFRMREFIAASEVYERLLSEFRGDLALTFNLALCHLKSGRPDAAAAGLRQILEARPDHTRARVWLRVAEAATPALTPSGSPATRPSVRPSRLDELPRVALPPGTAVAQDATGVVSVRVGGGTRWLARPEALHGYEGDVAVEARSVGGNHVVSLSGNGTAFLRGKGALVVIELRDEEICVRASSLIAYASTLLSEAADPQVVGEFDEDILRLSGGGAIVLEVRAELVALPVSLEHATTVRWDSVIGWTGHVIGAPSDSAGADGHLLARFAGNGSLLMAMQDEGAIAPAIQSQEWYGRYQVLRRLEGTPTEEVLLARSHGPGGSQRKVILRRRLSRCDADSPFLQLLAREIDAYAVLTHPAVVRLYDFLLLDGHPVLVLEYVSGVSLASMDAALGEQKRAIGDRVALYIAHGVFSALAAAHGARDPDTVEELAPVIHRDVRAGNVLLGWNGDVKLGSFATAKASETLSESTDVRAASLLLYEMLVRGRALDRAAPEPQRGGTVPSLDELDSLRPDLSPRLRDALRVALGPNVGSPAISAADMVQEIEMAVDLPSARRLCAGELAWLRESAFGNTTLSTLPPPVVANADDSAVFQSLYIPKPSPVPQIAPDVSAESAEIAMSTANADSADISLPTAPLPTARRSLVVPAAVAYRSDTLPPIQPPSLDPGGEYLDASRFAKAWRRGAPAIGFCVIAVVAGAASISWPSSSDDRHTVATEPRERTDGVTEVAVSAAHWTSAGSAASNAPPLPPPRELAPAAPTSVPAPAAPTIASDEGILQAPPRAAHHRIFVDGRVIGEGTGDYRVRCGVHSVRVGSKGDDLTIEIPCGGSVAVE